jgi:phosphonopyruvate decarboxylase
MIDPVEALRVLTQAGIDFYTGVPDSLLKDLNACIADQVDPAQHVVAHNEGGAIALSAGHYLATGRPGLVYMQNSGLGNAVNPLVSLTSSEVYGIPMLLMIGWRGQPGRHDEPQHAHQGRVTEAMLATLDIPVYPLDSDTPGWPEVIKEAVAQCESSMRPTALLVSSGTFAPYDRSPDVSEANTTLPSRSEVLTTVIDTLPHDTVYVATTGYTARELAAIRVERGEVGDRDFLGVGSMGHASSIALGMAVARPQVSVVCLDGDGAIAMHMGALALIGGNQAANFGHVLINNGVHESVGGQPTSLRGVDAVGLAMACGYRWAQLSHDLDALVASLRDVTGSPGPWLVEATVRQGVMDGLPRPGDFTQRADRLLASFAE